MKLFYLLVFFCCAVNVNAQEYWDREDFEIGNRGIENTWREYGFVWQTESTFNLPDGSFLHLKNEVQKKQVDMLAIIDRSNRNKIQREIDLGSPLPKSNKEKKLFEVTGEVRAYDRNDVFNNPYFANPFLNNYNNTRGFGIRRYTPYRYVY
ncbi:hypothetical protein NE848_14190 [Gramella jeungdoensis]|uniref:DUF2490 domain-containing protein n=1 Tax=Gramella jeungdoensis TaxID=708091 RepID=A0ABT0Z486_9FLAO|nr:hypothetical protein [Gramella jeungdoensis]MCM8570541.1 hypothetical protein [Gramella jeungdoensis]